MAIKGGPGSGKSCVLLEALIALVRLGTVKQKKFKILVTGDSDDTVDSLALKLHRIRSNNPDIAIGTSCVFIRPLLFLRII